MEEGRREKTFREGDGTFRRTWAARPRAHAAAASSRPQTTSKGLSTLQSLFSDLVFLSTAFFIFVSGHLRGSPCLWMLSYQSWKIQIICSGAAAFRVNCNLKASSGCLVTKLLQCHVLFFWDDMYSSIYSQICLRLMLESAGKCCKTKGQASCQVYVMHN